MPESCWNTISYAVYVAVLIVTAYGSILFYWWWRKCHYQASAVFLYVMFLFVTKFYSMAVTVQGYTMRINNPLEFAVYAETSWAWATRLVPLLIVLICIVAHMSWRAFGLSKNTQKED